MTYRETIRKAALAAARHAMPGLPDGLVRWQEDPAKQPDPKHPNIVLSTVSHVANGEVSMHQELENSGTVLTREFAQRWFWTVQIRVEGWKIDVATDNNPWRFVNRMRFGWRTLACQRAMDDYVSSNQPWQTRRRVQLVTDPGEIRDVTSPVAGHRLPQYLYELEFSYVDYDVDSEKDATLDEATITGEMGGTTPADLVTIEV